MRWPYVYNPPRYEELHSWYSPDRKDNFATTADAWAGNPRETRSPDYRFVRIEGQVVSRNLRRPPDTVPVYAWYHPGRGDNFLTTDPRWAGSEGDTKDGYRFVRLEGYAFSRRVAGTLPLYSWYHPERNDNFTTTDPRWTGRVGDNQDGYRLYRREGFILAPTFPQQPETGDEFAYGDEIRGIRPLLVVLVNFSDFRLSTPASVYQQLLFGPGDPNLVAHFWSLSNGKFSFRQAGVVGPVQFAGTVAAAGANDGAFDQAVVRLAAAAGFNFADFANEDGVVGRDELAILAINANYGVSGGQTRPLASTTIGGVQVQGSISACDEFGGLNLFSHELFHGLGFDQHIYGPAFAVNQRASVFASSPNSPDHRPIQLDPWHGLATGWLHPRIFRIADGVGAAYLDASSIRHYDTDGGALLFYDPARGRREYLLVEYRSTDVASAGNYDTGALGNGIAVWYAQANAPGTRLTTINWPARTPAPGGNMEAHYLAGPSGFGVGPLWQPSDGEFPISWPDGNDAGLRLRVGRLTGPKTAVQWRQVGIVFGGRIDDVRPASASPGAWITLDGMFPVATDEIRVVASRGSIHRTLTIRSTTMVRITVELPAPLAAGRYQLHVLGSGTSRSNGFLLSVT